MFRNNLALLALIAILFSLSCDKKDKLDPNKTYLLTSIRQDNKPVTNYTYDDQHRVAKVSHIVWSSRKTATETRVTYFYGPENRIQHTISKHSLAPASDSTVYQYDNEGRIAAMLVYDQISTLFKEKIEYSYTSNMVVGTVTTGTTITSTITFEIDGSGNITKITTDDLTQKNHDITETYSDFDDRPNVSGPKAGSIRSKNNPVTRSYQSPTLQYSERYAYYFNEVGKLAAMSADMDGLNSPSVREYIYTAVD